MQKSKMQNHIMCPLRGLVQHRPKNPPNFGRMGCLYQLLSPKGYMILFCTLLFWIPQLVLITFFNTICFAKNFSGQHLRRHSDLLKTQKLKKKYTWTCFIPDFWTWNRPSPTFGKGPKSLSILISEFKGLSKAQAQDSWKGLSPGPSRAQPRSVFLGPDPSLTSMDL